MESKFSVLDENNIIVGTLKRGFKTKVIKYCSQNGLHGDLIFSVQNNEYQIIGNGTIYNLLQKHDNNQDEQTASYSFFDERQNKLTELTGYTREYTKFTIKTFFDDSQLLQW